MRYTRLLFGIVLIVLALWIIVGEQLSGASADAVVNAPISTVRTPVAGKVALRDRTLGSAISQGEEMASVANPRMDDARLNDLAMEHALATAELAYVAAGRAPPGTGQPGTGDARLAADLALAEARLAAIAARLLQERQRLNQTTTATLTSTVNGQLWDVLAADGEVVQAGQDVLRLADCDRVIVTLSVSENIYNRLSIGDAANFRLAGDGRTLPGTIIRMAGSGALSVYRTLAVAPSQRHLERFDITLIVPALRNDPALRCSIGQTGRAFFEPRPMDWLRGLWT